MPFKRFFHNLQQELKAFLYLLVMLSLFRAIFIYTYNYQLADTSEIWMCMWYGLRLSLKTVGWIMAISFVISALPHIISGKQCFEFVRKVWYGIAIFFLTICFFIKIPYYKIFNSGFDLMLINGIYDDFGAIVATAVEEYELLWRLPLVILVFIVLILILYRILILKTCNLYIKNGKILFAYTVLSICFFVIFAVFVRYGGAFNYAGSITWESSARLKSNLLNEAILDDAQALYRVKSIYKRSQQTINSNIDIDELKNAIKVLGGVVNADNIKEAFAKEVGKRRVDKQPKNIVFILGETYALWPFLPEYQQLGLVEKGLKLKNSSNALSVDFMLARGSGTMPTLNGLISGLTDAGIYENYEKESFKSIYATGIGAVMKDLGYKTIFWYGGFDGWQNIKNFVLAQGFDEFHSSSEFENRDGNSWGGTDKFLFEQVKRYMVERQNEKIFYFILTTSNHPPYNIDVVKEGFDKERIRNLLPDTIFNGDQNINALGHIWYADQVMGKFVEETKDKFADTLFVITGDHAERFNFAKEVDLKTFSAVPCIFYGSIIDKSRLSFNNIGTHIQIIPTLVELVGDRGDKYSSVFTSLFDEEYNMVFNHKLWANNGGRGVISQISNNTPSEILDKAKAARTVTIWRVKKGNKIEKNVND